MFIPSSLDSGVGTRAFALTSLPKFLACRAILLPCFYVSGLGSRVSGLGSRVHVNGMPSPTFSPAATSFCHVFMSLDQAAVFLGQVVVLGSRLRAGKERRR